MLFFIFALAHVRMNYFYVLSLFSFFCRLCAHRMEVQLWYSVRFTIKYCPSHYTIICGDLTAFILGPKLKPHHVLIGSEVCLAPINSYEDSNLIVVSFVVT